MLHSLANECWTLLYKLNAFGTYTFVGIVRPYLVKEEKLVIPLHCLCSSQSVPVDYIISPLNVPECPSV